MTTSKKKKLFKFHTGFEKYLITCDHVGVILLQAAAKVQRTSTRTWAILKVCNEYFIFQDGQKLDCLGLQALKSNGKAKDRSDIKRRERDVKCKTWPTIPRR